MEPPKPAIQQRQHHAAFAILLTCILGWAFAYLFMNMAGSYGFGLFILLPFVMGAICTLLYCWNNVVKYGKTLSVCIAMLLVFFIGLMIFAFEGLICIIMVAPLSLLATLIGNLLAYEIIKRTNQKKTTILLLLISVPSLMGFETLREDKENIRSVTTSIEITAKPEAVWKNVIAFSPLKEPTELLFKTGIAYPVNATIKGSGVGAVRHCNFSTGSFVEPITVWNEPQVLKFSVVEQPPPMKELSFYDIEPNHLHGYWVSKQGEFKLTRLLNGNTLLEGTTWYVSKIRPGFYWNLWSDHIVHKIHKRVLRHIKEEAEK